MSQGQNVFIALMQPRGGIHDRACELYQQLVGIKTVKRRANIDAIDNGPNLVRAVYGPDHYDHEHKHQTLYKPKYLKQVRGSNKKYIFAFPDGLPGGWNSISKAHFVAHSQGAQTVRYLQYLLSIDYFSYLD